MDITPGMFHGVYNDPMSPPPLKLAVLFLVLVVVTVVIFSHCDQQKETGDGSNFGEEAPVDSPHGWFHGAQGTPRASAMVPSEPHTADTVKAAMKSLRRVQQPPMREGLNNLSYSSYIGVGSWNSLRAVLEVKYADGTEPGVGFALGPIKTPPRFILPSQMTRGFGVVGFDPNGGPNSTLLTFARSEGLGWRVIGSIELPTPITADWEGYRAAFQVTDTGDPLFVLTGRLNVTVFDPNEDPFQRRWP